MKRRRLRVLWPLAALALLAGLAMCRARPIVRSQAEAPPAEWLRVDFIDVGHGDAALITSPTGKSVLIDGGSREAGHAVVEHLRQRQIGRLDLVLVSHRHEDHIGGLAQVISSVGARLFMDAPSEHDSRVYQKLMDRLKEHQIPVRQAERGRRVDLGRGAWLTLLGPPDPPILKAHSEENANSVMARLDYGRFSVLFAGDAEAASEAWLLASGADVAATVLKVGHHASATSSSPAFLAAVRPRLAVVSADADDAQKEGHQEVFQRLERLGIRAMRTDLEGTITIKTDGSAVQVQTKDRRESL